MVTQQGVKWVSNKVQIQVLNCYSLCAPFSFPDWRREGWNGDLLPWGPGWSLGARAGPSLWVKFVPPHAQWQVKTSFMTEKDWTAALSSNSKKEVPVQTRGHWRGLLLQWGGEVTFTVVGGPSPRFSASSHRSSEVME